MKALLTLASFALLALIVLAGGGAYMLYESYYQPGPLAQETTIEVPRGAGVSTIAAMLEEQGIIEHALVFKAAARLKQKHRGLKAGEYLLLPGMSASNILEKIYAGDVVRRAVTIPEGLTSWEVVQRLQAAENLSGDITEVPPEGSLLPETYDHSKDESRAAVLKRMQEAMNEALEATITEACGEADLATCTDDLLEDRNDLLTLASIIEKETAIPEEREAVAGVFINRLRKGMPLQTDPTVIYALTKGKHKNEGMGPLGRRLLRKDLEYDSPYNTYKYPGLPPGPIANPGRASIAAALSPEEHDYLYFVADGTGGHAFGKTLNEHNANVAKWRKIRRQKSQ